MRNAVERNKIQRRLREIVGLSAATQVRTGHDYVLDRKRAALDLPLDRMTQDFEDALRRVHAGQSGKRNSNDR